MPQRFPLTLTQLVYFAECAKTLNMTAASQELHVAQSAVSTAITQLERALGAPLFIRQHSKGLVLTPAGETLLRHSHQLFDHLNDTIETIRAEQSDIRGSITVACFNTLAPFLLPQLISTLQQRYPELAIEVTEGDHEESLAALRGGRAELAITYNLTDADGIDRAIVGEFRPHVIVHTEHRLASRKRIALADVADDPFVLLDLPSSSAYFQGILLQAGIMPKIKLRDRALHGRGRPRLLDPQPAPPHRADLHGRQYRRDRDHRPRREPQRRGLHPRAVQAIRQSACGRGRDPRAPRRPAHLSEPLLALAVPAPSTQPYA
jgi:DNA-binding transcriptional LysR family regulator